RLRVAMKPISTVPRALDTIDTSTGEPAKAINQRSDAPAVPAAGVVAEAMVGLVLAEAAIEKFGGDSAEEMRRNAESYLTARVVSGPARPDRGPWPCSSARPARASPRWARCWPNASAPASARPTPTSPP